MDQGTGEPALSVQQNTKTDGVSTRQNPVVDGLAAGGGGGKGLLLVAAAAAPAYFGFKFLADKVIIAELLCFPFAGIVLYICPTCILPFSAAASQDGAQREGS